MSNQTRTDFVTPVGRIVQGNLYSGNTTDDEGQPLLFKTGKNAGQPRTEYFFALAIRKDDPGLAAFRQLLDARARADFPHMVMPDGSMSPHFSSKVEDGDSTVPNKNMIANSTREGFPGHMIFKFSGSQAPNVVHKDSAGNILPVTDQNMGKRGHFVQVSGDTSGNGRTDSPGMYLNFNHVLFAGYGEEIASGPSASDAFANAPAAAAPAGMSATPLAVQAPAAAPAQAQVNAAPPVPAYQPPATTMPQPQFQQPAAPVGAPVPPPVAPAPAAATYAPPAGPTAPATTYPSNAPAGVPPVPGSPQQ